MKEGSREKEGIPEKEGIMNFISEAAYETDMAFVSTCLPLICQSAVTVKFYILYFLLYE